VDINYNLLLCFLHHHLSNIFKHQCLMEVTPTSASLTGVAATTSSSGNGTGMLTKANSSTLSIHLTGTISRPFFTFSGIS